jgi:hypothetical protein
VHAYGIVMKPPVPHCIFYLDVGKILGPDLTQISMSAFRPARDENIKLAAST